MSSFSVQNDIFSDSIISQDNLSVLNNISADSINLKNNADVSGNLTVSGTFTAANLSFESQNIQNLNVTRQLDVSGNTFFTNGKNKYSLTQDSSGVTTLAATGTDPSIVLSSSTDVVVDTSGSLKLKVNNNNNPSLIFDEDGVSRYYMGLDSNSPETLFIGSGGTVGSNVAIQIEGTTVTIENLAYRDLTIENVKASASIQSTIVGGASLGTDASGWGYVYITDDKYIHYGESLDVMMGWNNSDSLLQISQSVNDAPLTIIGVRRTR